LVAGIIGSIIKESEGRGKLIEEFIKGMRKAVV
jgi:hypothetical protein